MTLEQSVKVPDREGYTKSDAKEHPPLPSLVASAHTDIQCFFEQKERLELHECFVKGP